MTPEYRAGRASRIFRIVICLLTMGFVFPSAFMDVENERRAAVTAKEAAEKKS